MVRTIGASANSGQIAYLWQKAHAILPTLVGQVTFHFTQDSTKHFIAQLRDIKTSQIQVDGPERYKGVKIDINKVYRFLDQLKSHHKEQIEYIAQKFIDPVKLADFLLIALS